MTVIQLNGLAEKLANEAQASFAALVKRYGTDAQFGEAVQAWAQLEADYQRAARKAQLAEAGLLEE